MGKELRVTRRNARFQQWQALLTNRTKRQRAGEFIVQGVRPITLAVEHGWTIRALIYDDARELSTWATGILDRAPEAQRVAMAPDLLAELGGKSEDVPELLAVVALPPDDLTRIAPTPSFLAVAFDRPTSPGNIGTLIRSADAFGAHGVIINGHAADPYDPKAVRASTGSLFAVPTVRARSHREVMRRVDELRADGLPITVVGTDEKGEVDITEQDLTGPVLLVVGNETGGLSAGWRESCDVMVRIPITGSASSLNAASAATVALYETARQRA
ncbi:rRNA methyltransferase [Actinomadura rubrobrunea]|uniref:rRNA methyltransferase n=1 Tax=Actinomadura rubrobrunea TaxID=115335 RepID=A0A9W6UX06_9ACTN|nr:TrmH family RNA methyltransferase [Actinomadura rubrobrunea]GLW64772.1 rRNA methyltransferase [Actinomadura rubrobrunea]